MFVQPRNESSQELLTMFFNSRFTEPGVDGRFLERQKYSFASVFYGWQPTYLSAERRRSDPNIKIALNIGYGRFKTSKSHLRDYLSQPMCKHDPIYRYHPSLFPTRARDST